MANKKPAAKKAASKKNVTIKKSSAPARKPRSAAKPVEKKAVRKVPAKKGK